MTFYTQREYTFAMDIVDEQSSHFMKQGIIIKNDSKFHTLIYIAMNVVLLLLAIISIQSSVNSLFDPGNFSIELIPWATTFLRRLFGSNWIDIKKYLVLGGYVLTSVSWSFYAQRVTQNKLVGFMSGLLIILPAFPFSVSISQRLNLVLTLHDGGHVLALFFLPLSLWSFDKYLQKGSRNYLLYYILTGISISLVSFFTFFVLCIFQLLFTLSHSLIKSGKLQFKRLIGSIFLLAGIIVLIYNVTLFQFLISDAGRSVLSVLENVIPISLFLIPVLGIFTFLIFDRRPSLTPLFITLVSTLTFAILNFIGSNILQDTVFASVRFAAEEQLSKSVLISYLFVFAADMIRKGSLKIPYLIKIPRELLASFLEIILVMLLIAAVLFIPRKL